MSMRVFTSGVISITTTNTARIGIRIPQDESVKALMVHTGGQVTLSGFEGFVRDTTIFPLIDGTGVTIAANTEVNGDLDLNLAPMTVLKGGEFQLLITNPTTGTRKVQIWILT